MRAKDILQRLDKVRGISPNWSARCPAHDDKNPSLSIKETQDGTVLLHCHARCATEDVVSKLGLKMSDLYSDNTNPAKSLIEAYSYEDALGNESYQVLRYSDKSFPIRQPDGHGGWKWTAEGIERVPYRLPQVIQAVITGIPVFITEGEKDVHTVERLGYVATCGPGGSNGWRTEFGGFFDAADILLCGDNDDAGRKYLLDVATSCTNAKSIKQVNLPALSNDVSDWVQSGGNREAFEVMVALAHTYDAKFEAQELVISDTGAPTFSEPDLASHDSRSLGGSDGMKMTEMWGFEDPPARRWLIDQVLPEGHTTIIAADGGTGKSYLGLYAIFCTVSGIPFFDHATCSGKVLYVDFELDETEQKRRWVQVLAGFGTNQQNPSLEEQFFYLRPSSSLSDPMVVDHIGEVVRENDIKLVILDSLTIGLGADATDQQAVTRVLTSLRSWGTVLAIDHVSGRVAKGNVDSATPFGSVFKRNMSRSMLGLVKVEGGGMLLSSNKNNFGPAQDLIAYEMTFSDDGKAVIFTSRPLTDESIIGALDRISTYDVTYIALCELADENFGGLVSPEDIYGWRLDNDQEVSIRTIRNHLTALKRREQAVNVSSNQWQPVIKVSPITTHHTLGVMNSDRPPVARNHGFSEGQRVHTPIGEGTIIESNLTSQGKLPVRFGHPMDDACFYPSDLTPLE